MTTGQRINNVLFSNLEITTCFGEVFDWHGSIEYVFSNEINATVF